ncbi:MAG: hypothetical protein M0R17_00060 [Candidatus Omnitrophica bacterium]|jgi:hypothetical protein|nr:hypothetical protein [Candidatus Omnitrophota bacterium]
MVNNSESVLAASGRINNVILMYAKANNIIVRKFMGSVKIDVRMKEFFSFAIKVKTENKLTKEDELYLFSGKKAKYGGYLLLDVRKIS